MLIIERMQEENKVKKQGIPEIPYIKIQGIQEIQEIPFITVKRKDRQKEGKRKKGNVLKKEWTKKKKRVKMLNTRDNYLTKYTKNKNLLSLLNDIKTLFSIS